MQLSPRYDGPPILEVVGVGDPSAALMRQRRRFVDTVAKLADAQWATQSRCEAWTVKDVIAHLVGVDQFWALSFSAALRGEPTRFLVGFDPVATPAALVDKTRDTSPQEVFESFRTNVENLGEIVEDLDDGQWSMPSEAPPGHVALRVAAMHGLWDAWVHERDVMVPLGLPVTDEPDELELVLRYVAGLTSAFDAMGGSTRTGRFVIEATDPSLRIRVDVGTTVRVSDAGADSDAAIAGRAVDLIDALSHRAPLTHKLPSEDAWMLRGLARAFDKP